MKFEYSDTDSLIALTRALRECQAAHDQVVCEYDKLLARVAELGRENSVLKEWQAVDSSIAYAVVLHCADGEDEPLAIFFSPTDASLWRAANSDPNISIIEAKMPQWGLWGPK